MSETDSYSALPLVPLSTQQTLMKSHKNTVSTYSTVVTAEDLQSRAANQRVAL